MAQKLTVPGTDVQVKPRNPVAVGFLSLTIVYAWYHWYAINREMRDLGRARNIDLGSNPGRSAAAVSVGWLVVVPPFWTAYTTCERIKNAQMATGRKDWLEGWIGLLMLFLMPPLLFGFAQDQLNKAWQNLGLPTPYEKPVLPPAPGYYGQPQGQPGYPQQPGYPPPPPGYGPPPPGYTPPPPGHRPPDAPQPPPPPPA
jgi:hypothetical protein